MIDLRRLKGLRAKALKMGERRGGSLFRLALMEWCLRVHGVAALCLFFGLVLWGREGGLGGWSLQRTWLR